MKKFAILFSFILFASLNGFSQLTLVASSVYNVSCKGGTDGSIDVSAYGGVSPYTYKWSTGSTSNTISVLSAGTYNVTLTDAIAAIEIDSITITEPAASLSSTITGTNVTCTSLCDGSMDVTPTGGTPPYFYSWPPGNQITKVITGLCPDIYTCSLTDSNGCQAFTNFTITEPTILWSMLDSTSSKVVCNGNDGKIYGTVTGGTRPYSYAWSTGSTDSTILGLTSGVYYLTVTDVNNCVRIDSTSLTDNPAIVVNTGNTLSTCGSADGTAVVTVTGGVPPYYYNWMTGATTSAINSLSSGSYNISIIDANGCQIVTLINVNDAGGSSSGISNITNSTCNGSSDGSITVTTNGGSTPYSYSWSTGDTTSSISGLIAGSYIVTVTDSVGCLAVDSVSIWEPMELIPNFIVSNQSCMGSCDGNATVSISGGISPYTYTWYDMIGVTVSVDTVATGLCPGKYLAVISDVNGCTDNSIIVVNVSDSLPVADFSFSDTGLAISFANLSVNADSYYWDFGDGNTDTTQTPIHIYSDSTATYNVCLTASNSCGINTFCDSVNILHTYYPMLSDSSYWYVVETPGFYYLPNTEILQTYNTVQIDSVSYFEILSYTSRTWASPIVDTVYLREDSNKRKVYLKYSKSDSGRVIYDFLLQVGDSIYLDFYNTYYDNAMYSSSWFYVDSIKNKLFEFTNRNVWYLNNHSDSASIKWIEGIGSTISPVYTNESFKVLKEWYPLFPDFNGSNMLLTCKYNGILQEYYYENADTCFYDLGDGINDIKLKGKVKIYPNPISGMFVVEIELTAKTDLLIQLINITGQIIYSESVNTSSYKNELDLSGYAKGIYSLKVVSDGEVVCRKVVYK